MNFMIVKMNAMRFSVYWITFVKGGIDIIRNFIECCRFDNDLNCGDIVSSDIFSNTYLHDKHDRGIVSVDERRVARRDGLRIFSGVFIIVVTILYYHFHNSLQSIVQFIF